MRWICAGLLGLITPPVFSQQEIPKAADPRLTVELVAAAPDIVHPVACDFDAKGRLLVIESHTHFAPQGYKGPKFDRIRAFTFKAQGRPSLGFQATTFYEGTRHTMDLAVHPDGSVYVATRNEIVRLRDTKGTGVADEKTRIVFLDTKGDYPHNGLSGLCFDSKGDLIFGMGENLGAAYKLIGSDGVSFSGQGDGGHIFHCSADGKHLRRIATGFWNPFGNCRDIYGRLFCVDNDPDQSPPCRMLHVVEGGDYGFRFMYGRSGKHPFQSWHGELPGTLPMMTGVGEAPCEILSYESDGLPKEYLGQLLVTSWADHRVERYQVTPHGASFKAERLPFVQGGNNFRPTGMCVAPDGSLYVADWVLSNYTLHGKGAIWHIRWNDALPTSRDRKGAEDPRKAILSKHRPLREAAARKLGGDEKGREYLFQRMDDADNRVRAAAYHAWIDSRLESFRERGSVDPRWLPKVRRLAETDPQLGIREMAVRDLIKFGQPTGDFAGSKQPGTIRAEAVRMLRAIDSPVLFEMLNDADPFLRHAAVEIASWGACQVVEEGRLQPKQLANARERAAALLVYQRVFRQEPWRKVLLNRLKELETVSVVQGEYVSAFLKDSDEEVRFLAVKWVADEKLAQHRKYVENMMQDPKLSVRMYLACATALARLDGQEVSETKLADYFAKRLADDKTPAAQRAVLLRQVPASHKLLTINLLQKLGDSKDADLKREAIRALADHPSTLRHVPLIDIVASPSYSPHLRGYAMLGLLDMPEKKLADYLKPLVGDGKSLLRIDALRALNDKREVEKDRPSAKDLDAWLKRLEGKADAESGERIFFHPKVGMCARCHRIDGRGADVGPDLSGIGRTERRAILESILQPSNNVAPHYQVWSLELHTGKVMTGTLIHTHLDEYTFLDSNGGRFKVKTGDITEQRASTASIMPDGLIERMTDQELRDLLAYLQARK